jgi:hypothetical protein
MRMSRLSTLAAALGMALRMTPATVHAQDWIVQPRVGAGVQDYQLRFDDVLAPLPSGGTDIRGGFRAADSLPFGSAGLNFVHGRAFVDLSGQWSRTGHDGNVQVEGNAIGNGVFTSGIGQAHDSQVRFQRQEFNATLGWSVLPELSVYAGYKYSIADFHQSLTPQLSPPSYVDPGGRDGNVLFFGDYLMRFTYRGGFIGAAYAVPVAGGQIGLQSSLARLDGQFSQRFSGSVFVTNANAPGQRRAIDPTFKDGQVDGVSFGLNVGLSWSADFGFFGEGWRALSYVVGADQSQYRFDAGRSKSLWAADISEKNTRLRLELRYRY